MRSPAPWFVLSLLAALPAFSQTPTIGACTVLPADNIWNTPIDQLAVSPNSSTYVNTIGPTLPVHADFGSGTNTMAVPSASLT